jgi:type I restriction enzyme S subunit
MNWPLRTLDELGKVSRGKSRHRPRDADHLYGGPYPFIQTGDVKHAGLYVNEYTQTYSDAGLAQSKLWPPGTLCITIAANIADTAILSFDACFPDSIIGFTSDPKKADPRFIKYLFDANLQKRFQRFTQGATQDNLSEAKLLSLKFPVPDDVELQKRIADILAAYDDLIENNRRRIQLLEQAARLLFKEWFVRLRFPGHEHVKVVVGVPGGWKRESLSEICEEVRAAVKPIAVEPNTPYIGLEHMPRRSITLDEWGSAAKVQSTKFWFEESDILFCKIRPYFHKVGFTLTKGITSSDAIVLRPSDRSLFGLCLFLTSSDQFVAFVSKTVKEGSKMPRADVRLMMRQPVLVPPNNILLNFNVVAEKLLLQLRTLAFGIRQLQNARDLLLPRLMNGTITV